MSCGGVSAIVLLFFLMHLGAKSCFPHTPSAATPHLSNVLRGTATACLISASTPCSAASDRTAFRLPPRPEIRILSTPCDKSNCSLTLLTPFQARVFEALDNVQAGSVTTYKRLAGAIGCKSAQAIGQALKRNPLAPRIPCHRVISESRYIGGYSGKTDGLAVTEKRALLLSEGITFDAKGRVCARHIISILATDMPASPPTTETQEERMRATCLRIRGGGEQGDKTLAEGSHIPHTRLAPKRRIYMHRGLGQDSLSRRHKDEEVMVPDHVESMKEALKVALDGQTVYVRAGEHRWRGELEAERNKTLFVRGEGDGSRLWGQWGRRLQQARAGVDSICFSLPFCSQGSFGSVVLAHETLGNFDACVAVSGGPWMFGHSKLLSSHATALRCSGEADVIVRRCGLGGLEPAEVVQDQVFGNNLARYAVYAIGNASVTLQACALENTGRAGGIGARFAGAARGTLQGCMLRCNDIALSLDDRACVQVTGSTAQRNAWSAWHVGFKCFTAQLVLSHNTVIGREWFNIRRPAKRIPRYHTCCNGRGCTKCYFSLDSMLPNKVLIDHAHRVSGRAPEREEDDMRYAEEEDGNHTRFILHYDELKDEVELEHQVFGEDEREKAMEIPENVTGPGFLWRMNKPAPLNETRLGTEGLPAVAKWWDRMNAHYI